MNDPLSGGAENAEPEPTTPQPANAVDALRRAALAGVARSSSLPGRFAQFAAQKAGAERPAVERVLARRGVLWLVLLHPALNLLEKTPVDVLLNKHLLPLVLSERARYLDLKGTLKADPGRHGADPLSGALEDSEDEDEADEKSKSWDRYFQDTQLRATINQDVTRTFQDHPLFREPATQRVLDEVLFVWARQHGDIGYRQGMHEVAAIVFWVLHGDRALDPALASDADPTWNALESPAEADVEADCHAIFSLIMKLLLMPFYMHKPPATATAAGLANPAPAAAKPARPTPLLATSARIFHSLLAKTDPQLYRCLRANGVEEQVWGVRWLRLLFSREVPPDSHDEDAEDGSRTASVLRKVVEMWTVIFAGIGLGDLGEERGRQVVEWTAVEMLVAVRDKGGFDWSLPTL